MNVVLTVIKRCSGNWCYLLYEYWFVREGTVTEWTTIRKDDLSALFVDNCLFFLLLSEMRKLPRISPDRKLTFKLQNYEYFEKQTPKYSLVGVKFFPASM